RCEASSRSLRQCKMNRAALIVQLATGFRGSAFRGVRSARKEMPVRAVNELRTMDKGNHALRLASCMAAVCYLFSVADTAHGDDDVVTPQIAIDQFGWLPRAGKVAILADPVKGQNAGHTYRPGTRFEIRREADGTVAYRGATKPWNSGRVSELAGDRVWYAVFSDLQDRAARYTQGGKAQGRPRDMLGGWFDAGDLNKYVPYLEATLFDLLWAYELNP